MTQRRVQFVALRYALTVVGEGFTDSEEFVNIGVLLREPEPDAGFWGFRFKSDWKQVRQLDPDADIELLDAIMHDIQSKLQSTEREEMLRTMLDSFSNAIQLSPWENCLTDDPERELAKLASRLLTDDISTDSSQLRGQA